MGDYNNMYITTDDGIKIYYSLTGSGEQNYVLLHGTGANHKQLAPQIDYFSRKGRVLAIDHRGHGDSDKPESEYTIEQFSQDVAFVCQELDFRSPIIIGASMGGNIAVEIAAQYPNLPSAIALLDSSLLYPDEFLPVLSEYRDKLGKADQYVDTVKMIADNSCLSTDKCKSEIEAMLLQTPQHVWQSAFVNMLMWDEKFVKQRIKSIKIPLLYVEAHTRLVDLELLQSLYPDLVYGKVVGAGHLISLEAPEQVNPMVDRFIQTYCIRE